MGNPRGVHTHRGPTRHEPTHDMCTSAAKDTLNALHLANDEDAPVVTLEYGPYMN